MLDVLAYYDINHAAGRSWGPMNVNLRTGTATGDGTDALSGIDDATGSNGADTMIGNARDNAFIWLFAGNDTVEGRRGRLHRRRRRSGRPERGKGQRLARRCISPAMR
jgi:hypothetical protein